MNIKPNHPSFKNKEVKIMDIFKVNNLVSSEHCSIKHGQCFFLELGDVALAHKFGKQGNEIYRGNFHFGRKLHDFKEIFLGEVAFIRLQL